MSSELKLDEGLCRCCHAQGMFQNLSTPFVCQGQEEIYSEMLRECFNVVITPLEGEYSTSTYTICITCALKLRDANEFKKQVLECEERFKEVCKEVMKSLEPMDIDIKLEIDITGDQSIKEEPSFDDMDTGAEENYEVKSEEQKNNLDTTIKRTQTDDSKGKGRKLRVTSNKGKPAVKVKRQNRVGIPRRQKKSSNDGAANETDSTKNKTETVTGTRKKIADKKTLVDKSYKKDECLETTIKVEPCDVSVEDRGVDKSDVQPMKKRKYDTKSAMSSKSKTKKDSSDEASSTAMSRKDITTSTERTASSNDTKHPDRHFTVSTNAQSQTKHYVCTKCDMPFRSERTCITHVTTMHLDRKYPCPVCKQTFKNKTQSINHLAETHGNRDAERDDRAFQCRICGKSLKSRDRLYGHMKHHILMTCRLCGVVPNNVKEMAEHLQERHGVEIPTCGVCGYKNRSKHRVLRHQRKVHMKEKNLGCDVCDMKFFDNSSLNKHMVCHKSARAYECEYCHKKFQRASTVNTHRKIHTGEKNKVCAVCGERFVQKASLNYHMMKRHPEAKY